MRELVTLKKFFTLSRDNSQKCKRNGQSFSRDERSVEALWWKEQVRFDINTDRHTQFTMGILSCLRTLQMGLVFFGSNIFVKSANRLEYVFWLKLLFTYNCVVCNNARKKNTEVFLAMYA